MMNMSSNGMVGGTVNSTWQNSEPRPSSQEIMEKYNSSQNLENEQQPEPETKSEEWECECGSRNTGKYCAQCGKEKPSKGKKCLMCRTINPENAKYCIECGKPLE